MMDMPSVISVNKSEGGYLVVLIKDKNVKKFVF